MNLLDETEKVKFAPVDISLTLIVNWESEKFEFYILSENVM